MILAWVLVDKPDIILLDEPMAGIDIGGEETVFSLLHRIWKDHNLTIVLITHNISIIWKHATRILCLNKTLVCHGTPEETLTADILKKVYGTEVSLYEHRHPTAK
jgi:zinc transport system ATP-binding protein